MIFLKHKNMKDVCAHVLEDLSEPGQLNKRFRVLWINILGTFNHPDPFPMGTKKSLAIEEIEIPLTKLKSDWKILNDPRAT